VVLPGPVQVAGPGGQATPPMRRGRQPGERAKQGQSFQGLSGSARTAGPGRAHLRELGEHRARSSTPANRGHAVGHPRAPATSGTERLDEKNGVEGRGEGNRRNRPWMEPIVCWCACAESSACEPRLGRHRARRRLKTAPGRYRRGHPTGSTEALQLVGAATNGPQPPAAPGAPGGRNVDRADDRLRAALWQPHLPARNSAYTFFAPRHAPQVAVPEVENDQSRAGQVSRARAR